MIKQLHKIKTKICKQVYDQEQEHQPYLIEDLEQGMAFHSVDGENHRQLAHPSLQ